MITLYTHSTPNGFKIAIALEELDLAYKVELVDIFSGGSNTPEFLKLNPLGKIPVIFDDETGETVYESNVILLYLARKTGKLLPTNIKQERVEEILFVQGAFQGPMFGQRAHFSLFATEIVPYAIRRYEEQGEQVNQWMNKRLENQDYLLGEYSIADISFFGWYAPGIRTGFGLEPGSPLAEWFDRVNGREAVQRGLTATPSFDLPERRRV